jgi:hypothetical protein
MHPGALPASLMLAPGATRPTNPAATAAAWQSLLVNTIASYVGWFHGVPAGVHGGKVQQHPSFDVTPPEPHVKRLTKT